jgi:hypothetical protein
MTYVLMVKDTKGHGREIAKKFGGRQVEGGTLRDVYEFEDFDSLYAATDEISQQGMTLESYANQERVYAPWNAHWDILDILTELPDPDDRVMVIGSLISIIKEDWKKEYQEEIFSEMLENALAYELPPMDEETNKLLDAPSKGNA